MNSKGSSDLTNHKRKEKSMMPVMMAIVVIMGLVVGIGSFSFGYKFIMSDSQGEINTEHFSANDIAGQAMANLMGSDIDAVVKSVDVNAGTITFLNLKNETTNALSVTENSILPQNVTLENITVGDIYTYVFNKEKELSELKECSNAWEFADYGITINKTAQLIKFTGEAKEHADRTYKYVEGITTAKRYNEIIPFEQLSPLDLVKVKGYDNGKINKIYSIEVQKGHGQLQLRNLNSISYPVVYINNERKTVNKSNPNIYLAEGTYNVKVTGSNCDDIVKEVNINPKEPYILDLAKAMVKSGVLNITANVTDYKLYINDKEYSATESNLLEYGTYTIKATKEGYQDYTGQVTIDEDENSFNINMVKIHQTASVTINAVPADAVIYINNNAEGKGTVTKTLPLGSYIASAKLEGYADMTKQINLSVDGQQVSTDFVLTAN